MKAARLALALVGLCRVPCLPEETPYAFVPASPGARVTGTLEVTHEADERVVALVGCKPPVISPTPAPRPVFVVEVPPRPGAGDPGPPGGAVDTAAALWPDGQGRIEVSPSNSTAASGGHRNPWEPVARTRRLADEAHFLCGGTILGGEGGGVALINGQVCRRGDVVGSYRVAQVLPASVLLERNGSLFGIPRGRPTTISAPGD